MLRVGEDELVDVMALFKINIARQASSQREREHLRAQTVRRFARRGPHKAPANSVAKRST